MRLDFTPYYGFKKPLGNDTVNVDDFNYNADIIDEALKELDDKTGSLPPDSVNDTAIGTRTPDQTQAPASPGTGTLTQMLSWLANRIKAITGKPNWWDAPPTTLQAAKNHHDAYMPHVPSGLIAMWSGLIDEIPSGWFLCDGTGGTPDLRDRFIVGAGSGYDVGDVGGEAEVSLTSTQLPSHSHGSGTLSAGSGGSHSHSASSNTTGSHTHTYTSVGPASQGFDAISTGSFGSSSSSTGSSGSHSHTISISSAGSHSHSVTGSTASTGSGKAHENRPPYFALAFIMRL